MLDNLVHISFSNYECVRVLNPVDNKFSDLTTNADSRTFSLAD